LPPVAVAVVAPLEVAVGFWLVVGLALLVLELLLLVVLVLVAVLLPVVLLWLLVLGPAFAGPAPLLFSGSAFCANAIPETKSAEIASEITVLLIATP
jgi:hypothetical protein